MEMRNSFKNWEKDELPRERLIRYGAESLSDRELLAILLSTGTKGKNVLELADDLLLKAHGLKGMGTMNLEEISICDGVGIGKGSKIVAAIELGKRISAAENFKETIHSSKDVVQLLRPYMQYFDREVFRVILLNTKNKVLRIDTVSVGGLNSSSAHPREVFKTAIKYSAGGIILAHNHPSGIVSPSNEDKNLTKRLCEAGNILGIPVLDHLIIGEEEYFSFKENGLF